MHIRAIDENLEECYLGTKTMISENYAHRFINSSIPSLVPLWPIVHPLYIGSDALIIDSLARHHKAGSIAIHHVGIF